jgi:hypothetical protein
MSDQKIAGFHRIVTTDLPGQRVSIDFNATGHFYNVATFTTDGEDVKECTAVERATDLTDARDFYNDMLGEAMKRVSVADIIKQN